MCPAPQQEGDPACAQLQCRSGGVHHEFVADAHVAEHLRVANRLQVAFFGGDDGPHQSGSSLGDGQDPSAAKNRH
jgi:hypothetical protein